MSMIGSMGMGTISNNDNSTLSLGGSVNLTSADTDDVLDNGGPSVFSEDGTPIFDPRRNVAKWMLVFNHDTRNGTALRFLENYVDNLKRSYVLVANNVGVTDFVHKVGIGVDKGVELLLEVNPQQFRAAGNNKAYRQVLRRAVEAYAFIGVHDMVFNSLVRYYAEDEKELRRRAAKHGATMSGAGYKESSVAGNCAAVAASKRAAVGNHAISDQNSNKKGKTSSKVAIFVGMAARNSSLFFEDLNKERCPLAKLEFLRDYMDASSSCECDEALDADETLATLVERVINLPDDEDAFILANLQYMRNFSFCPTPDVLAYLATQFHTAVCFVLGSGVDDIGSISASINSDSANPGSKYPTKGGSAGFRTVSGERYKPEIISHPLPQTSRCNRAGFSPRQVLRPSTGSSMASSSDALRPSTDTSSPRYLKDSTADGSDHEDEDEDEDEDDEDDDSSCSSSDESGSDDSKVGVRIERRPPATPGDCSESPNLGSFLSALKGLNTDVVTSSSAI